MRHVSDIQVNKIHSLNIHVNGKSYAGRASEVTFSDIQYNSVEVDAIGMAGKLTLFSGLDKLEMKIKFISLYSEVLKELSNPLQPVTFELRCGISSYNTLGIVSSSKVTIYATGHPANIPLGTFKNGEDPSPELNIALFSLSVVADDKNVLDIDVPNNKFEINGRSVLPGVRN